MIDSAYVGEDVPLTVTYDGGGTDPDAAPTITIEDNSDGTEIISAVAMTSVETGVYEYVWDSEADANGAGTYNVETTAEFSSETKINRSQITLK